MSIVCRTLAAESQGGLFFHAAALVNQTGGVLLPGNIGAGKSTFTAWLLSRGLNYLTDEMVYFPLGAQTFQPFYRPLHIKAPSRGVLAGMIDRQADINRILRNNQSDLIPPDMLNSKTTFPADDPSLRLILFPRYAPQGDFIWQPLTPAETGWN